MSETTALAKTAEEKAVQLGKTIEYGEAGIVIRTVDDLKNLAKWSVESGFLPEQIKNAQQAFVIMVSGAELGLKPMAAVKFLYLTKARRVALMTKGALAVVQSKPTYDGYREWIEGEGTSLKACAWAKRKGSEGITKEFSYADAEVAGLLRERRTREGQTYDSTYQNFLKDMLLSRARGRVLDIVFAAELGGIPVEGVAEDIDMMEGRRRGQSDRLTSSAEYSEPRPPRTTEDPLLKVIASTKGPVIDTEAREIIDPAFVKVIDEQVEEIFGSGPPPAVQPATGTPAATTSLVRDKSGRSTTPAGPGAGGGDLSVRPPEAACSRCKHKLNLMGGCDVCGWPGDDIR